MDGGQERRFGPYFLARRLGHGGMGEVFLAYGPTPSGPGLSVVKLVKRELLGNDTALRRFEDEARLVSFLESDAIARLYDAGFVDDAPFMALEYISGLPLHKATAPAKLPLSVAVQVATRLLAALAAAHAAKGSDGRPLKIVHRDVSPQNIMLDVEGRVKLIDFGIARSTKKSVQTRVGQFVGKMRYAPPEQLLGDDVDARADVFAAGVVVTELFSGRRFYERMSDNEAATAALDESWTSPSLEEAPAALRDVLAKATARHPADRYASANAFQAALVDALGTLKSGGASETRSFLSSAFPDEVRRLALMEEEAALAGRRHFDGSSSLSEETTTVVSVIRVSSTDSDPMVTLAPTSAPPAVISADAAPATVNIRKPALLEAPVSATLVNPVVRPRSPRRPLALGAAIAFVVVVAAAVVVVTRGEPPVAAPNAPAPPSPAPPAPAPPAPAPPAPAPPAPAPPAPAPPAPTVAEPVPVPVAAVVPPVVPKVRAKRPRIEAGGGEVKSETPLNKMLAKARAKCGAVAACAELPASVDAESAGLEELLAVQQKVRACLDACEPR